MARCERPRFALPALTYRKYVAFWGKKISHARAILV